MLDGAAHKKYFLPQIHRKGSVSCSGINYLPKTRQKNSLFASRFNLIAHICISVPELSYAQVRVFCRTHSIKELLTEEEDSEYRKMVL